MLITFATEDMGDTPKSPCFVKATPIPAKNKHKIKTIYLLNTSFLLILVVPSVKKVSFVSQL